MGLKARAEEEEEEFSCGEKNGENRDPNFQYVVQRSYLESTSTLLYYIMSSTTLCVGTEHQFVELISV